MRTSCNAQNEPPLTGTERKGRVDIILATYNGGRFVEQQIDSILGQMRSGHRLLIRDDGSTDNTLSVLQHFASSNPDKIVLIDDKLPQLGACQSFGRLLEISDADYVTFCDQDDVWLPGRIDKPLERIQTVEKQIGADTPVLAHSDLVVVDESLRPLAPSFWSYSNLDPYAGNKLNRLLVQNVVTGCATMVNRSLARLACPIPVAAPLHDWWLALVASAFGQIVNIPDSTVLYRQHGRNQLGATRYDWRYKIRRINDVVFHHGLTTRLQTAQRQAKELLEKYAADLNRTHQTVIADFLRLRQVSFLCRRRLMLQHGFWGTGRLRNLGWLLMA